MAKHNCFCSLLTVDVSQSKEERRAGDLLGWAGTCWGRWGQGGGGRWQARSQTVVVLRKDLPPPHHQRARLGLSMQFGTEMYGFPKSSCRFISFPSLSFY